MLTVTGHCVFSLLVYTRCLTWFIACHMYSLFNLGSNVLYFRRAVYFVWFSFRISEVKWSLYRLGVAQRVARVIGLLFHDRDTRRGEWSAARPGRTLPPGKIRYPFHRRLGGPQFRSGRAENQVHTGIRTRTVQPVIIRYTDWAKLRYIRCLLLLS